MSKNVRDFIQLHLKNLLTNIDLKEKKIICAFNKTDLLNGNIFDFDKKVVEGNIDLCKLSCIDELNGIDELMNILKVQIGKM